MNSKAGKKASTAHSSPRLLVLLGILLVFLAIANFAIAIAQPKPQINGEIWLVNRVVSGQTVEASLISNPTMTVQRVRLLGISAPLKEQAPWGDRSRQYLSDLLKEKRVVLEFDVTPKDNSERLLAYIWKDNLLVNQHLVEQGLAIADPYEPNVKYNARISRAQAKARLQELGIWDTQNPLRLSPRDFRRQLGN